MSRGIPPKGMAPALIHRHACGHACDCTWAAFAGTTICRRCRSDRFNEQARRRQTQQEIDNDQRDVERAQLYLAHESGGPGAEW